MNKIAVSKIVEFRRKKTPSSQMTFVNNLRKIKPKSKPGEGGDYWRTSLSTIGNVFKSEQNILLNEKMEDLHGRYDASDKKVSKDMFKKNIQILSNFTDFNFAKLKPNRKLEYLSKPNNKSILTLRGLPIQILPNHIFTFEEKGIQKVGAVWFVAKNDGYATEELGVFSEALYRYLNHNYSKEFEIASDFCIAVDVIKVTSLKYTRILNKEIPSLLQSTLDSIKKVMNNS